MATSNPTTYDPTKPLLVIRSFRGGRPEKYRANEPFDPAKEGASHAAVTALVETGFLRNGEPVAAEADSPRERQRRLAFEARMARSRATEAEKALETARAGNGKFHPPPRIQG